MAKAKKKVWTNAEILAASQKAKASKEKNKADKKAEEIAALAASGRVFAPGVSMAQLTENIAAREAGVAPVNVAAQRRSTALQQMSDSFDHVWRKPPSPVVIRPTGPDHVRHPEGGGHDLHLDVEHVLRRVAVLAPGPQDSTGHSR